MGWLAFASHPISTKLAAEGGGPWAADRYKNIADFIMCKVL